MIEPIGSATTASRPAPLQPVGDITMTVPTADELIDQALTCHAAGRHGDAEDALRVVLTAEPDHADALNLLGLLLQEKGQYQDSVALLSRALAIDPDFPEALANLARVQRAAGDPAAAILSAEQALQLDPGLTEASLQLAGCLLDQGRGADAEQILRRSLTPQPAGPEVMLMLGSALMLQGRHGEALTEFDAALRLDPGHLEALIRSGVALGHLNRLDEALVRHKRAVAVAPDLVDAHAALALTCRQRQDPAASAEACGEALKIAPDRADLWLLRAGSLAFLGRFDEAAACQNQALSLNPRSAEAWRERAMTGQAADSEAIRQLQDILRDPQAPHSERVAAGFSLGRLLDTANAFDAAFAAYATANRLVHHDQRRCGNGFQIAGLRQHVDWLIKTFCPASFEQGAILGDPSDRPVFIVGMPRSGTTLVEQIAASHSHVFGAGERKDIHDLVRRLAGDDLQVSPVDWAADTARAQAGEHIARLTALGGGAARIIDKMPDNIQFLGHIAVLFPNARIILCRRDLRDTCLSAFFQQFGDGMNWTSDLGECAARAQEIERLIAHWQAVVPLPMLEIEYEHLVTDLEGQSRRLIAFLGLDWEPACLTFHQTQRPIMTASYWQVRQPVYTASCGRWRHYRQHLAPLLLGLAGLVPLPEPEDWDRILLDPEAAVLAAAGHHQAGRLAIAEVIAQHLLRRHPDHPAVQQGLALLAPGQVDHAQGLSRRAVGLDPESPAALLGQARILAAQGQPDRAEHLWRRLLERRPGQLEAWTGLTQTVAALGRYDEAIDIQRRTIERFPGNALLLYQLGWLLWRSQNPAAAIEACKVGLGLEPDQTELWLLMANCRMLMGEFEDAIECYRHASRLDPSSGAAFAGLTQAGGTLQGDAMMTASAAIVSQRELPVDQRVAAAFAIARYHEECGDYDAAFASFSEANSLARTARANWNGADSLKSLREFVDWAIHVFQPEIFVKDWEFSSESELPGYIAGMPRSGTTLVEQIAASHPLVFGEGERTDLENLVIPARRQQLPAAPENWDAASIRTQADRLLATLRQRGGNAVRVINKLPNNILWLGHISLLFPKARIIVCRRDLRDVCLSCYSQNFADPATAWADTLDGCAMRAREIHRLLDHWRRVLPAPALEIQYETLVGDLEGQSRRLIGHLGLDWAPACLTFHETRRPVMTASNWQVRQPLYNSSVGKWRHYRKHLGPLFSALRGLIPEND